MLYMDLDEFTTKYPFESKIAKGTYGKVYVSGKYAIKRFKFKYISDFIIELNAYATLDHPCILKPIAWSYDPNRLHVFLVMPLGEDIITAYKGGKITIEEIVSDTLSALVYINRRYVHGDIKYSNIIFHENKAKFIDFSLFRKSVLAVNGKRYIKTLLYSPSSRDPEFYEEQFNNISCEMYALAITYYMIYHKGEILEVFDKYSFKTGHPHLDEFLKITHRRMEERPPIEEVYKSLPKELIVRRYEETKYDEVPILNNSKYVPLADSVIKLAKILNIKAETLFLALHLLHRLDDTLDYYKDEILLVCSLLTIACSVCDENELSIFDWNITCQLSLKGYQWRNVTVNIMKNLKCKVSSLTYWDYARSKDDLPFLLDDICRKDYNPLKIRKLHDNYDKYVTVDKIDHTPSFEYKDENKVDSAIIPTDIAIHQDEKYVFYFKDEVDLNPELLLRCAMHNANKLHLLEKKYAYKIYCILKDKYPELTAQLLKFNPQFPPE